MKKILYVGGFEFPSETAATLRAKNIGQLFEKVDFQVDYFSIFYGTNEKNFSRNMIKKNYIKQLSISGIVREIKSQKPSIVVMYNLPSILMLEILILSKMFAFKTISDCTEWYDTKGVSIIGKPIKAIDVFFRMHFFNNLCDGIICISTRLSSKYKKRNKIMIPPLMNSDGTTLNRNHIRLHNYIFAGNGARGKDDLEMILQSFFNLSKRYRNFRLKIIGLSKKDFLKSSKIDTFDFNKFLDRNVIFMGRLPHYDTVRQIESSDFSIFFRDYSRANNFGFPTKLSESISLGVPVITNDFSDINLLIKNGINSFYIKKFEQEEIEKIIGASLDMSDEDYSKMKKEVFKLDFFLADKYISEMSDFINEIYE